MPRVDLKESLRLIRRKLRKLGREDRGLARILTLRAVKNALVGEAWEISIADLKKFAKPKAVDWDAILAFLEGLQPIIEQLMSMCQE